MTKIAIVVRGIVMFLLMVFILNVAYTALVFPRLPPHADSIWGGLSVLCTILALSLTVAIFDIRRGFKKWRRGKGQANANPRYRSSELGKKPLL
jgi:hypothetical protein